MNFDEFSGYEKSFEQFKKLLSFFGDTNKENSFFDSIIYGLLFKLTKGKSLVRDKVESVLGREFYNDICKVKDQLRLDTSMYGFFDKCALMNEYLKKKNFLLKFYERRYKHRYLMKEGAFSDNKIAQDLSSSVIEKFNGYEIIKRGLRNKEKEDFSPIYIVYEPSSNKDDLVICYFTDNIHLAFRSYISKKIKGEEKILHNTVRQCHYCENYLSKTEEAMQKHTKICTAI